MFTTENFIKAEVAYRGERLRKDWGTFGRPAARRTRSAR